MDNFEQQLTKQTAYLRAIATLLAGLYQTNIGHDQRIELLLAQSGLGYQEIADILGKKPDAVRMFLKRNTSSKTL